MEDPEALDARSSSETNVNLDDLTEISNVTDLDLASRFPIEDSQPEASMDHELKR